MVREVRELNSGICPGIPEIRGIDPTFVLYRIKVALVIFLSVLLLINHQIKQDTEPFESLDELRKLICVLVTLRKLIPMQNIPSRYSHRVSASLFLRLKLRESE